MWSRSSSSKRQVVTNDGDPERVLAQVQELSDWLLDNPQINGCNTFENLHFFLRTSKFDVERTKKKLKNFYQMRAERTEWFDNRDPKLPEIQELLNLGVFLPIGADAEQRMVVVIRTAAHDPKLHSQNNVFKVIQGNTCLYRLFSVINKHYYIVILISDISLTFVSQTSKMILDLLLKLEPETCTRGMVAILDMQGVQLGHALQMNPKLIKRSVESWTAYPCQPKLLEFTNAPRLDKHF